MHIPIALLAVTAAALITTGCSEGAAPNRETQTEAQMPGDVLAAQLVGSLTEVASAPSGIEPTKGPVRYYQQGEALLFVADIARSQRFYSELLGLPVADADGPGAGLSLFPNDEAALNDIAFGSPNGRIILRPASGAIAGANETAAIGWIVTDVGAVAEALAARGVRATRFPGEKQDALGVWTAPNGDRFFWFADPDGYPLVAVQPKVMPVY